MRKKDIDFIIIDIMMPVMNGLDDDVKKSMEVGMNIHISKPVEERKLLAAVERVMVG